MDHIKNEDYLPLFEDTIINSFAPSTNYQIIPYGNDLKNLMLAGDSLSSRKYMTLKKQINCGLYKGEKIDMDKYKEAVKTIENTDPSNIILTSDWHFDSRGLPLLMDKLLKKCNENTILLVLGDIAYSENISKELWLELKDKPLNKRKEYWLDIKKILSTVPHKKAYLVLGNHDEKYIDDFYKDGFDFVGLKIETSKYLFSHMPIETNKINIHGHNHHNKRAINFTPKEGHDVGFVHYKKDDSGNRIYYDVYTLPEALKIPSDYTTVSGEIKVNLILKKNEKYLKSADNILTEDYLPLFEDAIRYDRLIEYEIKKKRN